MKKIGASVRIDGSFGNVFQKKNFLSFFSARYPYHNYLYLHFCPMCHYLIHKLLMVSQARVDYKIPLVYQLFCLQFMVLSLMELSRELILNL